MKISVVIPCYQAENTLESVVREITDEFRKHPEESYQIILVNDGSRDNTFRVIEDLCGEDPDIVGVDLSRNYSQANAIMAALPFVNGEVVVYMDDDGQHPANGIFRLAEKIVEGYDVAYADFREKKHSRMQILTSRLHNIFMISLGVRTKGVHVSSFAALSRLVADNMKNYHSSTPGFSAFFSQITTRIVNVEVEHRTRMNGRSGYDLRKRLNYALKGFVEFTLAPLKILRIMAELFTLAGIVLLLFTVFGKGQNRDVLLVLTGLSLCCSCLLWAMRLLGEYIGEIFMAVQGAPQYTYRTVINAPEEADSRKN